MKEKKEKRKRLHKTNAIFILSCLLFHESTRLYTCCVCYIIAKSFFFCCSCQIKNRNDRKVFTFSLFLSSSCSLFLLRFLSTFLLKRLTFSLFTSTFLFHSFRSFHCLNIFMFCWSIFSSAVSFFTI